MVEPKQDKKLLSDYIKELSVKEGFIDCGISKANHLNEDAERMEKWLSNGYNAGMQYLERNKEKRYDPRILVEGAKSVITFLYNYYQEKDIVSESYKISRYAYGKDYHFVIKDKLFAILNKIQAKTEVKNSRVFVDSAPVLDRAWAYKSGLGFIGKNTMLINKKLGSYFFIGHIILDVELIYNEITLKNYCGNCTACIDACPNNAITLDGVDSGKCISYLTIEHKGDFAGKVNLQNWIYGCDICQEVCPWNRFAASSVEPQFKPSEKLKKMNQEKWNKLSLSDFNSLFENSAVQRTGYKGIVRNIKTV